MKKIKVLLITMTVMMSILLMPSTVSANSSTEEIDTSMPQEAEDKIPGDYDTPPSRLRIAPKTQEEAVAWVKAQIGKNIDYDGVNKGQCIDLTKAYIAFMGSAVFNGNAKDYATVALPEGWTRYTIAQTNPQPGDICIWLDSGLGHVGIVVGENQTVEQNITSPYNGTGPIMQVTRNNFQMSDKVLYGVLRPTFSGTTTLPTPNTLGDWVIEKTWEGINIGIWDYYETEHTLRWLYLDIATSQWHEIQKGSSNWTTLLVNKGQYLVQVEVYDKNNNLVESKAMGTDGASNSIITAINVSQEANGNILLGALSNNPNMSYCIKLYNYNTGQWFTQYNAQWASFTPEKGVQYHVQFEIYGWNRMLDYQGYDFVG